MLQIKMMIHVHRSIIIAIDVTIDWNVAVAVTIIQIEGSNIAIKISLTHSQRIGGIIGVKLGHKQVSRDTIYGAITTSRKLAHFIRRIASTGQRARLHLRHLKRWWKRWWRTRADTSRSGISKQRRGLAIL